MLRSTGATVALRRRQQRTTLLVAKRFASGLSDKDLDLENYPVLPDVSRQHAPAKGWDDMLARRNFGDPVHPQEELYSMWGPDISSTPPGSALRQLSVALLSFVGLAAALKYLVDPQAPMVRRSYPFSGLQNAIGGPEENQARKEQEDHEE